MKKLKLYQKTSCGVKLQTCEERQCLFELIPLKKRRMIPIFERLCPFYPMCCCWEPWWRRCPLRWYYDHILWREQRRRAREFFCSV